MTAHRTRYYRAKDGVTDFFFEFVNQGSHFDIYCRLHPSLNGRDPSVHKTHLYSDERICFVSGKEPRSLERAEHLAAQWAEYFLEYRRTGIAQS